MVYPFIRPLTENKQTQKTEDLLNPKIQIDLHKIFTKENGIESKFDQKEIRLHYIKQKYKYWPKKIDQILLKFIRPTIQVSVKKGGITSQALILSSLKGATLIQRCGIVLNSEGYLIKESIQAEIRGNPKLENIPEIEIKNDRYEISSCAKNSIPPVTNPTLFSNHGAFRVYGHFLFETLCSAYELRNEFINNKIKIIIPQKAKKWQQEMLASIGIASESIIKIESNNVEFKNLIVSSSCSGMQTFQPSSTLLDLVSFLKNKYPATEKTSFIHLTRINAETQSSRSITNEKKLQPMLSQLGFKSIDPGKIPFPDQVRLFSNAKIVIGIHGSAFANSIFMPEGSTLIDLIPSEIMDAFGSWTKNIATLCNLRHCAIECKSRTVKHSVRAHADVNLIRDQVIEYMKLY